MSYVQGTRVGVIGAFTDPDTGGPFDPEDVKGVVQPPPASAAPTTLLYSRGEIEKIEPGKYRFFVDTSPASGEWCVEMAGTGGWAIAKQRSFPVTRSLAA